MSTEDTLIYDAILAHVPLTDVIGTGPLVRSYPDFLALEIPLPGIVVEKPETQYINTIHDGTPVGSFISVTITSLAKTRNDAEALADLVQDAVTVPSTGFRVSTREQDFFPDTETYATVSTFLN